MVGLLLFVLKNISILEKDQFIKEISYITGNAAIVDVVPEVELMYYVWNCKVLVELR